MIVVVVEGDVSWTSGFPSLVTEDEVEVAEDEEA